MGSLFDDDGCGRERESNAGECEGCICDQFSKLEEQNILTEDSELFIVPDGGEEPLDLGGLTTPTVFTFRNFDPDSCCVTLTYQDTNEKGVFTRSYLTDCTKLQGITCIKAVGTSAERVNFRSQLSLLANENTFINEVLLSNGESLMAVRVAEVSGDFVTFTQEASPGISRISVLIDEIVALDF